MTLEDFFTLTKMKDGITTTNRVKDLVSIMNNEKDSVVKNINDMTRQWSTVASAIAATENRDCLDLFIKLDGLRFIDRWLNDAQKFGTDKGDSFVEESITALLGAVENLRVDNQNSVSSGIWTTVKNLLGHSSSAVHEKAKALFDSWKEDDTDYGVRENRAGESDVHHQEKADDVQNQISERALDDPTVDRPLENHPEGRLDTTEVNEGAMEVQKIGGSDKLGECNTSLLSSPLEQEAESKDSKTEGPCLKVSEGKTGIDESESPNLKTTNQEKEDEQKTYLSSIEDFGGGDEDEEEHDSDEAEGDSGNDSDIFKPVIESKNRDVGNKRSDIEELDYGMVDPLEVARQVAMEVEREMDCREASCSSSEKRPDSPHSTNGKQSHTVNSPPKDVQTGPDLSTGAQPEEVENVVVEQENRVDGVGSAPVTKAVQEPEANEEKEKGFCDFDLNEEVCSEDNTEQQPLNPVSTPVSIVSASRAAAATGLPGAPLQFEGTFGFKGPTATSAFRPASPRRSTEGDNKTLFSLGGTHSNSKQRLDFLDFDLNVAECGVEKPADPVIQIPFSSALVSGESSLEASSRRSERLDLDLNLVSDGGDAPPLGRFLHRNGLHSPSPSSSSSTMQPSLRNIDLNDQPSFLNDSLDRPFFINSIPRSNDSVISIMGARVEVNRKDFVPQNGRTVDPTPDLSLARTGGILGIGSPLPYTHSPIYGYNGYVNGPGPTVPFTSAMYGPTGPIPYMVDSRGTHVVPQILGSASAIPHAYTQQPFFMSMSGAPSGSNGAGPSSGHSFDLNTGLIIEGGNRETGGLRQFLNPGQVNSQPSSSIGAGKRKEPDSGWDPYPFNYKHHQSSPWK